MLLARCVRLDFKDFMLKYSPNGLGVMTSALLVLAARVKRSWRRASFACRRWWAGGVGRLRVGRRAMSDMGYTTNAWLGRRVGEKGSDIHVGPKVVGKVLAGRCRCLEENGGMWRCGGEGGGSVGLLEQLLQMKTFNVCKVSRISRLSSTSNASSVSSASGPLGRSGFPGACVGSTDAQVFVLFDSEPLSGTTPVGGRRRCATLSHVAIT
jgi:hypothetical protein